MKTTVILPPLSHAPGQLTREARRDAGALLLDFLTLTKPRIAVLVLFTVAIGSLLGAAAAKQTVDLVLLVNTLIGTGLVAAGASALNQLLEKDSDALMRRTENRPLPAGRLQPMEVLVFGVVLSVVGLGYLALATPHALGVVVAGVTLVSYVLVYTPLKRHTTLNTLIGAVPGALPPVIGWTAVTGTIDVGVIVLFLIVFLWQVPHFLAIAWMYREEYGKAGMRMLPVVDAAGGMTSRQMMSYCAALVPVSLLPVLWAHASIYFGLAALLLGLAFFGTTVAFARNRGRTQARRVLHASLIYLPALLSLLLIESFW
jgi:protoheme IX farnesyltransferase